MSLFFTTRHDGVVECWDLLHSHQTPVIFQKVVDHPLYCIKLDPSGKLAAPGAGDGTTVVGSFSENLLDNNKTERSNTNDMLERETRRERILENLQKSLKIREKQLKMIEKVKDMEKQKLEEHYKKHGHPVELAEKNYFASIEKMKMERQRLFAEIHSQME